jgi:NADH-quinone oxidoreductase subunit J
MVFAETSPTLPVDIAFYLIAAVMVVSAVRVVTTRNVVHAALYLVMVLAGVAAQYILLASEFVAITQVLVYIGAIVVLFLFGIMLTKAELGISDDLDNNGPQKVVGVVVAVLLAGLMIWALNDKWSGTRIEVIGKTTTELGQTTPQISDAIFSTYLVPFEVASVLLLAALIGAIVLARRD